MPVEAALAASGLPDGESGLRDVGACARWGATCGLIWFVVLWLVDGPDLGLRDPARARFVFAWGMVVSTVSAGMAQVLRIWLWRTGQLVAAFCATFFAVFMMAYLKGAGWRWEMLEVGIFLILGLTTIGILVAPGSGGTTKFRNVLAAVYGVPGWCLFVSMAADLLHAKSIDGLLEILGTYLMFVMLLPIWPRWYCVGILALACVPSPPWVSPHERTT